MTIPSAARGICLSETANKVTGVDLLQLPLKRNSSLQLLSLRVLLVTYENFHETVPVLYQITLFFVHIPCMVRT